MVFFYIPIFVSSCKFNKFTSSTKLIDVKLKPIISNQLIVELNVASLKSQGSANGITKLISLDILKQNAMADALKKTGADILIEPVFVIETYNANVIVTVSGFPAKYIHFKSFTLADTMLINHHSLKYRLLLN